ncbi:MAG: glycosyltransferase [Clostridia bacterium]|nr:glycosyltransferase [Clostridia bacterium]
MCYDVSVIIPVYNAQEYLKECINSIIKSSVFNKTEVLLIDDGSKDSSGEICDSFSAKHENIKTFHIANGGVSNARNLGLDKACGEYVTFCDSDDYYINGILEKVLLTLESKPDLLFYDYLYEQEKVLKVSYPFPERAMFSGKKDIAQFFKFMLKDESFNSSCNKFFKYSVIRDNNLKFQIGQKHGEDRDFVIKFLSVCQSAFYLPETGYFYRYVKSSAVNKSRTDYFDNVYNELIFKREMSKKFDLDDREAEKCIEEKALHQIISCTFAASENDFSSFKASLHKLFENDFLMKILNSNCNASLQNSAYKKIHGYLLSKQVFLCWSFIKGLKLKERIYKLIH